MLSTTARLVASSARRVPVHRALAARPLSTTSPVLIRIKKPEGAAPNPSPSKPPSPAEKPAAVPEDITPPPPFEPEVNRPVDSAAKPASEAPEAPGGAVPPLEPPKPAETVGSEDAIPETPDLKSLPSLDIDPEATAQAAAAIEQPKEQEGAKGKKGKKRPEYVSSQDLRRRTVARLGYASLFVGVVAGLIYVGQKEEEGGEGKPKDNRSVVERLKGNFTELSDFFSKPAFVKLLPDPLPAPYQRPYTLLVDLEDLLVHSSWDRQYGWRTAKRPGVDYFLSYLSQFYEIVLFTNQPVYTALPVAEKLDPMTLYLPYKLFRESTRYVDGKVVKDLSYLNRDLSKVILLDTNSDSATLQPENAIIIKPWDGKRGDKGLIEMIPFLESIGIYAPADVRPVLKNYAGKDIPTEYAKVEAAAKEAAIREWEARNPTAASGGGGWLSGLIGGGSTASRPKVPMTYLEIKRAQAQAAHAEEQKYYKEHAEEFMKMIEEDKQRQEAEATASLMSMFGGKPPPAPGAEGQQQPAQKA